MSEDIVNQEGWYNNSAKEFLEHLKNSLDDELLVDSLDVCTEDGKTVIAGELDFDSYYDKFEIGPNHLMFHGDFDECTPLGFGMFRGYHTYQGLPYTEDILKLYMELIRLLRKKLNAKLKLAGLEYIECVKRMDTSSIKMKFR